MLRTLNETGIFKVISGLLVGKPMDETFYDDYKEALMDTIDSNIPIVYNLNVGHATPRTIVPFGVHAYVDATEQVIRFDYNKESWDEFLSFFYILKYFRYLYSLLATFPFTIILMVINQACCL